MTKGGWKRFKNEGDDDNKNSVLQPYTIMLSLNSGSKNLFY